MQPRLIMIFFLNSTQGAVAMCTVWFTSTTIATVYEDLAYSLWLAVGYNTMATTHAIVGGFYAFIFSHRLY